MLNSTNFNGRITKDLKLDTTANNKNVCSFTLAVPRDFKNNQGKYDSDFLQCQVWGQNAVNMSKMVGKGSLISINGHAQTSSFDSANGDRIHATNIIVDKWSALEPIANRYGNSGATGNTPPLDPFAGNIDPFSGNNNDPFSSGGTDPWSDPRDW